MAPTTFFFSFSTIPSFGKVQQQKENIQNNTNNEKRFSTIDFVSGRTKNLEY